MHRILFIAAAVGFGSIFTATASHAQPAATVSCAPTVVLAVDGTKGPATPDSIDPKSPVNAYTDQYRNNPEYVVRHIPYPGGIIPGVNGWDTAMDDSVEIGAKKLRKAIEDTEIACGTRTVYELYGYSQGAIVVRKVATEIDTAERVRGDSTDIQDRVRLHFIADPATGVPARYPGTLMPGVTLPESAKPFRYLPVTTECLTGDMVCDPNGDLPGYASKHSTYTPGAAGR